MIKIFFPFKLTYKYTVSKKYLFITENIFSVAQKYLLFGKT